MTAGEWQIIRELFEKCLGMPAESRSAFLESSSADLTILIEVKAMLHHHEHAERDFLQPFGVVKQLFGRDSVLEPGEQIADRFEVTCLLGRGGMGDVYEAIDYQLNEHVALKSINASMQGNPEAVQRLRREIQLARRVTHRNVCRVFDVIRHQKAGIELMLISMELVRGQTLGERLKQPVAIEGEEALSIAEQLLAGLSAAHQCGIIHRDLKPSNVMLSGDRVVIMDFGVARAEQSSSDGSPKSLTGTDLVIGTPGYMAPELLAGAPATARSDIYSVGVILKQLIGETGTTRRWNSVIRRCLDAEADRRFSNADQIAVALSHEHWFLKDLRPVAVLLVLAVALSALVFRLYNRHAAIPDNSGLLLADMVNATQDRELDAATEVLRSQLGQSDRVQLWDHSRVSGVLKSMSRAPSEPLNGEVAKEVAMREGIPLVLYSNITPLGDGMNLSLRLENLQSSSVFTRYSWDYSVHVPQKSKLLESLHEGAVWVRRVVGENGMALAAHDRPPQDTTTASWEALADFARAEHFQSERQNSTAIVVLEDALRKDPHFALAAMRLGDLLTASYSSQEGLAFWKIAVDETNRQRLTRREELRIRGLYASDTQDYAAAESSFAQLEAEYPHDYLASFYLAAALRWQNRLEESVLKMRAADAKKPDALSIIAGLASNYLLLGKTADLDAQVSRLRSLHLDAYASHYEGLGHFATGDYERSLACFRDEASSSDFGRHQRGVYYQAGVLCELGRLDQARLLLQTQLKGETPGDEPDLRADELLAAAYIDWKQGRIASAKSYCLEVASDRASPLLVGRAGVLLARSGLLKEARLLLARLNRFASNNVRAIAQRRLSGEILMAENRPHEALREFQKLDAMEPALRHREGLARALFRAGRAAESASHYRSLLNGATIWQTFERDYPGFLTDACVDAAGAASTAGLEDDARRASLIVSQRRGIPSRLNTGR